MDIMSIVVGALVGIPLSILANLLTPKFQAWRSKRSRAAAAKQFAIDEQFRRRVEVLMEDEAAYKLYVHMKLFMCIMLFSLGLIGLVFTFVLEVSFGPGPDAVRDGLQTGLLAAAVVTLYLAGRTANNVLGTLMAVGDRIKKSRSLPQVATSSSEQDET